MVQAQILWTGVAACKHLYDGIYIEYAKWYGGLDYYVAGRMEKFVEY
jgi:hypothetical protein